MFKKTNNIYNDFEIYKHKEIQERVNIMQCNSIKNATGKYYNTKTTLYYEVAVKLKNELDQREYKYNTLNGALTATYFLYLLVQKERYSNIEDYKLFTTVKDGKNKVIIEDATDNFHYWNSTIEKRLNIEIQKLKDENEFYKKFLGQFPGIEKTLKEFEKELHKKEVVLT